MTKKENKELRDLLADVFQYLTSFATISKEEERMVGKADKFIRILAKEYQE
jgi:hypothetical protein